MNDRFKFRFWRKNVEGKCVQESADLMSIDGSSEPYDNGEGGAVCHFPDCCICEQCTGLKDKNGKLIYENEPIKLKKQLEIATKALKEIRKRIEDFNDDPMNKIGFMAYGTLHECLKESKKALKEMKGVK